jgi:hypothetical protein
MIKTFFTGCLILPLGLFAQMVTNAGWTTQTSMPASEVIYYTPGKKLVWENFKGKAPGDNSNTAAITMSGFGYDASITSSGGKSELNIKVYCFFNKNRSWVRQGKMNAYILNHEQHHFDISYIAACIFIERVKNSVLTVKDYNTLLPRIYDECLASMDSMQEEYDGQTRNGRETAIQEKWNGLIDGKLSAITK